MTEEKKSCTSCEDKDCSTGCNLLEEIKKWATMTEKERIEKWGPINDRKKPMH